MTPLGPEGADPEKVLLEAHVEHLEASAARAVAVEAQEAAENSVLVVLARLEQMEVNRIEMAADLRSDIAEIRDDAKEIKDQVKATNGRVTKLELWRHGLEAVQAAHSWIKPAIIAFISGAGLSVLGYFLTH